MISFMPTPAKPKHRPQCKNAVAIVTGLILFEFGFLSGLFGSNDSSFFVSNAVDLRWNQTELASHRSTAKQPVRSVRPVRPSAHVTPPTEQTRGNRAPDANLPPSVSRIFPFTRQSQDRSFHVSHKFSQPLLLSAFMRLTTHDHQKAELVLMSTGVSMGTFRRNFSAAGCMIGHHVYPIDDFRDDRAICTVPKRVRQGEKITLILYKDDTLRRALKGPVTIDKGFVAKVEEGDLYPLPDKVVLHGELRDQPHYDLVSINSKVTYQGQIDSYDVTEYSSIPRYEVCMGTQIKPSIHLLPDWIDYHRRIGVDKVYIFDNDAEEDLSKTYANRSDVEVMYWPWEKSQIQAFTYAVYVLRPRCEWLLLADTDEYIMLGLGDGEGFAKRELRPFKDYVRMRGYEGYRQIWFRWVIMKNSGHVTPPPEPVPEAYIHREDPQTKKEYTLGKTMVDMDVNWVYSNVHSRIAGERALTFDEHNMDLYPSRRGDVAMIVHYMKRSWEEFQDKLRFGRANINNPSHVKALRGRNVRARDENQDSYMRMSQKNRKAYTHFRDIWRRVTKELDVGETVTVRYRGDRRCRTVYDFSRKDFGKGEERCEDS